MQQQDGDELGLRVLDAWQPPLARLGYQRIQGKVQKQLIRVLQECHVVREILVQLNHLSQLD